MREDPNASQEFLSAQSWRHSNSSTETVVSNPNSNGPKFISHSLSGGELNHWFIQSGNNFANMTPLSGLDMKSDARSFALLDYDRDGWTDAALANPAAPRTQLFRNKLSDIISEPRKQFSIRLQGGNSTATASSDWSSRDSYGAIVEIETSQGKRLIQHQAGEGLSAQNSDTISIGMVAKETIKSIQVFWPSGKTTKLAEITADSNRIIIRERAAP